jgi:hypothetical protein
LRQPAADQRAILRDSSREEYQRYFRHAKQAVKMESYQKAGVGAAVAQ